MGWTNWDKWSQGVDPEGYSEHLKAKRLYDQRRAALKRASEAETVLPRLREWYGVDVALAPRDAGPVLSKLSAAGITCRGRARWLNAMLADVGISHRFRVSRGFSLRPAVRDLVLAFIAERLRADRVACCLLSDVEAAAWKYVAQRLGPAEAVLNSWALAEVLRERGVKLVRRGAGMTLIGHRLR